MKFNSLQDWLDWQSSLNPKEIELGLGRVRLAWERLGAPPMPGPVVTVAGTNGKGSSVAFAEAILQAAGYRTGCYTSPHLLHYNERIRLDGDSVDDDRICAAFEQINNAREDLPLTYFEFGTLATLWIFAHARLDAVILEVGLGGRLDAVNLIDPEVSLITDIALDHQDWLGGDLESIAAEKAGILRQGRPAVFSGRDIPSSIGRIAQQIGARLLVAGRDYQVQRRSDGWDLLRDQGARRAALPQPRMRGSVQIQNAAGALVALDCLSESLPLDQRAVRAGLLAARLPGRFEVRPGQPTLVLDVAHNPHAAAVLNDLLGDFFVRGQVIAVCGMLEDKDAAGVAVALAGRFDAWHLVDLSAQPRGMSARRLSESMAPHLGETRVHQGTGVAQILSTVVPACGADDLVVVFGSFLTVAAAMEWLENDDVRPNKV